MVRKVTKRKLSKNMVPKNPWFRKGKGNSESSWGFRPINCKGWIALILLVGVNVFAAQYFNLNELVVDNWLKFVVVFLLSVAVFILIAKRKTRGLKSDI